MELDSVMRQRFYIWHIYPQQIPASVYISIQKAWTVSLMHLSNSSHMECPLNMSNLCTLVKAIAPPSSDTSPEQRNWAGSLCHKLLMSSNKSRKFGGTSLPGATPKFWKDGGLDEEEGVVATAASRSQLLWGRRADNGSEVAAARAEVSVSILVRLPYIELPTYWT